MVSSCEAKSLVEGALAVTFSNFYITFQAKKLQIETLSILEIKKHESTDLPN